MRDSPRAVHGYREDWEICLRSTAEGIAFGSEHGLVQTMVCQHCVHGWALAHTGKAADGLAELQSAIEDSVRIMGRYKMCDSRNAEARLRIVDEHIFDRLTMLSQIGAAPLS